MTIREFLEDLFKKYTKRTHTIFKLATEYSASDSDISILLNGLGFHYAQIKDSHSDMDMNTIITEALKNGRVRNKAEKILCNLNFL